MQRKVCVWKSICVRESVRESVCERKLCGRESAYVRGKVCDRKRVCEGKHV